MGNSRQGIIVVIDDDPEMRSMLVDKLEIENYHVYPFPDALEGLKFLNANTPEAHSVELVISDLRMPEIDGIQLLQQFKPKHPDVPVILMTAFATVESAIEGLRKGAFDYLMKPFKLDEMLLSVQRALQFGRLQRENKSLVREVRSSWSLSEIIGKSPAMKEIFEIVEKVAPSQSPILITGESGTGKEIIAKAIHQLSPRGKSKFVAVNCSAIPETLLESELFGYVKGAFTGANHDKRGLFEEAEGGTLFLDEIGDMPTHLQAKLLRVLQEKTIRPVGSAQDRAINVRILSATHKDLKKAIANSTFREDLYYRLAVIPIKVPSLKYRQEDIPLLAKHFVSKYSLLNGGFVQGFTSAALQKLMQMPWPGNVRELENLIERMVVLSKKPILDASDIPDADEKSFETFYGESIANWPTLEELEKRYITLVLEKTAHKKEQTAQILGIHRRTLYRKEKEYGFPTNAEDENS